MMLINARFVLILFILIGIVWVNPWVALFGMVTFGCCYLLLYYVVQGILYKNGKAWSDVLALRYKLISSSFGGIRDILVLGRNKAFIDAFSKSGTELARAVGTNGVLTQAPRYMVEFVAFGSLVTLIVVITESESSRFIEILPVLAVYAFAALKLLPAFQQLYVGVSQIRGNTAAFEAIESDLISYSSDERVSDSCERVNFDSKLTLENVSFRYPGAPQLALDSIQMQIDVNTTVGIVGPSGSGKTTILALLSGLISPSSGKLKIDGMAVDRQNLRKWKNIIGYVPQDVFISDASLEENIAFGISRMDIDRSALEKAVKLANLDDFVGELVGGFKAIMGERGANISGGQRQRIGIARALYNDPQVLIFDEATSALDGNTEKIVMDAIKALDGKKTIIMVAHRLKTVECCKNIFLVEDGVTIEHGTYDGLMKGSQKFRKLAGVINSEI
jgi:HlyD family secretion protein